MSEQLEKPIHLQRGWEYRRAMEMRRRRPRPAHEQADFEEQQQGHTFAIFSSQVSRITTSRWRSLPEGYDYGH